MVSYISFNQIAKCRWLPRKVKQVRNYNFDNLASLYMVQSVYCEKGLLVMNTFNITKVNEVYTHSRWYDLSIYKNKDIASCVETELLGMPTIMVVRDIPKIKKKITTIFYGEKLRNFLLFFSQPVFGLGSGDHPFSGRENKKTYYVRDLFFWGGGGGGEKIKLYFFPTTLGGG